MEERDPNTPEGKFWLSQFNQHLIKWIESNRTHAGSLAGMGTSLEHLFRRSPDYSNTIQSLAISTLFIARQNGPTLAALPIVKTGLAAAQVDADLSDEKQKLTALLWLFLAEIQLNDQKVFDGQDSLAHLWRLLDDVQTRDHVVDYISALASQLKGGLFEMGLELDKAGDAYFDAINKANDLRQGNMDAEATDILTLMLPDSGTRQYLQLLIPLVTRDIVTVLLRSRLGLVRISMQQLKRGLISEDEVLAYVNEAWSLVDSYRLPEDIVVTDVYSFITLLPVAEAKRRVDEVLQLVGAWGRADINDWKALLFVTLARRYHQAGKEKTATRYYDRADNEALKGSSMILALVSGAILEDLGHKGTSAEAYLEHFVSALDELGAIGKRTPLELRQKSLLDSSVATAVEMAFKRFSKVPSSHNRLGLGVLVDSLRVPGFSRTFLNRIVNDSDGAADALNGYELAMDRLGRIAHAIRSRPDTAVLVIQGGQEKTLFLTVTSDFDRPVSGYYAAKSYAAVSRAFGETVKSLLAGVVSEEKLQRAGVALYKALPKQVQAIIKEHKNILLCPDLMSDEETLAFELIYDGESYLGLSKTISRLSSLRDVMWALEPRRAESRKKRALVITAGDVPGHQLLSYASQEGSETSAYFKSKKWDSPPIDSSRLSSAFIQDRLKYISVLHVAAHGEVSGGDEAIVLGDNARLSSEDLLRRRYPRMPFVYLNTCLLAHTRYLGGGVTRGIAQSLLELGAGAIVANLTPVYDDTSFALSKSFYKYALTHPVGEALRLARNDLSESGVSPISWGTTVLMGDPDYTIAEKVTKKLADPLIRMLDSYLSFEQNPNMEERVDAYKETRSKYLIDPTNIRFGCGLDLVMAMSYDFSAQPDARERMDLLVQISDELNHLPSQAATRVVKTKHLMRVAADEEIMSSLNDAITFLDALRDEGKAWNQLYMQFLSHKKAIEMKAAGLEWRTTGPTANKKDVAVDALIEILQATQAEQEMDGGVVRIRDKESNVEDIAWNAIVIAYPDRFSSMPEEAGFASQLTRKLVAKKAVRQGYAATAERMLTGILHDLWGRQHSVGLKAELVRGWTGTLIQCIGDIDKNWSPLGDHIGKQLSEFESELVTTLAFLDEQSWDNVNKHIDTSFEQLASKATEVLEQILLEAPSLAAGAYAWIQGCIVQRNTFSPIDGSVDEDLAEHMEQLSMKLWSRGEAFMAQYLMEGFKAVREAGWDELQRWKLDMRAEEV